MCVILQGKKADVDKLIDQAYESNPDGCGLMAVVDGQPIIHKSVDFVSFINAWNGIPDDVEVGVHFRIGTHGHLNDDNCHPFPVGSNVWLMHNGIIRGITIPDPTWSDTKAFSHHLTGISGKDSRAFHRENTQKYIKKMMGTTNKFLFMDSKGQFSFYPHQAQSGNGKFHYQETGWILEDNVYRSNNHFTLGILNYGGMALTDKEERRWGDSWKNWWKSPSKGSNKSDWLDYGDSKYEIEFENDDDRLDADRLDADISSEYEREEVKEGILRRDPVLFEIVSDYLQISFPHELEDLYTSYQDDLIDDLLELSDVADWVYLRREGAEDDIRWSYSC